MAFFSNGFHLGRRTGVALGNESAGLVPTRAWKERHVGQVWLKGETVSASIGQGFNLTTPMQLAVAYAAIANGGTVFRPRILLRQTGPDGTVEQGPEPEALGKVPVSPEHLATITRALEAVVNETGGTGARARIPGIRVAGKTGTAQVVHVKETDGLEDDEIPFKYRDHGWFAAFAPAEAPEIVVIALAEHGGHGGSAAGPIVNAVLSRYFKSSMPEAPPKSYEPPEPLEAPVLPESTESFEEAAQVVRN
jgi:penicillin-binding protein 2